MSRAPHLDQQDAKSVENSSFQHFLFLFKIIEQYLKTPKNKHSIIQYYLKLFRLIQHYRVFGIIFGILFLKFVYQKLNLYNNWY